MFVELDVLNQQTKVTIDIEKLRQAAMAVLQAEHVASAVLSVTVVDNSTIHVINRDHLNHDYPTDVISFQLEFSSDAELPPEDDQDDNWSGEDDPDSTADEEDEMESDDASDGSPDSISVGTLRAEGCQIEGEVIVSAEYAEQMAGEAGWTAMDELTLYVVHGILHICGYDDLTTAEKTVMRQREVAVMKTLGLNPSYAANDLEDTSK
ncbi:MAG: rRNA maturation RNase YbeY [Planctomycetaceae bacterium]